MHNECPEIWYLLLERESTGSRLQLVWDGPPEFHKILNVSLWLFPGWKLIRATCSDGQLHERKLEDD